MIISSDWHLKEESAEVVFNEVMPGVIEACVEVGDLDAVCLGDLLHFRYKVPVRLLNMLCDMLKWSVETHGINWRILPGNHDQYEVGGRNALEVLDEIEGVKIFTNPEWDRDGLWVPYRKDHDELKKAFAMPDPFTRKIKGAGAYQPIAFMHHGVQHAWMNDNFQNTEGLPVETFQNFSQVFTGHYHKHHTIGNVTYIGSPYQTKADESGQAKGYIWFQGEQWQFVQKNWGRKYHRFTIDAGDELNFRGIDPRDDVRVRTAADVSVDLVNAALRDAGLENCIVTPDVETPQQRLVVGENATLMEYVQAMVGAQETPLDKDRLMKVFEELRR